MKKLILIRHGKSSWDYPVQDFERPLIEKGILNTKKIALQSATMIDANSLIWSSFAERALATAKIMVEIWKRPTSSLVIKKELYTFNQADLLKCIQSAPDQFDSLFVFGHNPAITDFVNKFGDIFIENVPTSGLVSLIFDTHSWSTISKGKTTTILFPRDI